MKIFIATTINIINEIEIFRNKFNIIFALSSSNKLLFTC